VFNEVWQHEDALGKWSEF